MRGVVVLQEQCFVVIVVVVVDTLVGNGVKYLRKTLTRVVVYPERRRDGAYRGRRVAVTAARGCVLRGGSERVRGGGVGDRWWRGRGMATAPGAWTPDGSIGDRRRRRHGHRTATPHHRNPAGRPSHCRGGRARASQNRTLRDRPAPPSSSSPRPPARYADREEFSCCRREPRDPRYCSRSNVPDRFFCLLF